MKEQFEKNKGSLGLNEYKMRLYYDQTEFKSKIKNLTKTKQICCISRLGTQFLALYLKVWGTLKRVMNDFPAIYLIKSFPFNFELWKRKKKHW